MAKAPPFTMRLMVWTAFWVFILDQATKWLVVHWLGLAEKGQINVWPPFLNFHMAWNQGVNFGLLSGFDMRWVLITLAVAISCFVVYWVRKDAGNARVQFAAGLLIGGAMGNVVDRVLYGAVADFLNMSCCGIENPYSFNVADIAVFAGAIGLVIFSGGDKPKTAKPGSP